MEGGLVGRTEGGLREGRKRDLREWRKETYGNPAYCPHPFLSPRHAQNDGGKPRLGPTDLQGPKGVGFLCLDTLGRARYILDSLFSLRSGAYTT